MLTLSLITGIGVQEPVFIHSWCPAGGMMYLIHPKKFGFAYLVNLALRAADLITCDGENSFEAIRNLGIPQQKIHLITHGVDTRKFSPKFRDPELFRQLFGNNWPVIIYIRGFDPVYDPETLIRAIPLIQKSVPKINFLIAGKRYEEANLQDLADNLGISASIHFCDGWIPHKKLPLYLASSDVYVSTSLSDGGVAVSTFEAMASGLPVIVTNVGDNQIWIQDDENGFIIPPRNPEQLAEKILCLVRNPEIRNIWGRKNRVLVEEKQDYYKEMEKVHILYTDLVKR